MFAQNRSELRRMFFDVWTKINESAPLTVLESLVAGVIDEHPEYHHLLSDPDATLDKDYAPESGQINPFLHMAMHIAIREQLGADRPPGIVAAHRVLSARLDGPHEAEHAMLECLGEALWTAQRRGAMPDEAAYLECVRRRAGRVR